jgi:hypothetical protein
MDPAGNGVCLAPVADGLRHDVGRHDGHRLEVLEVRELFATLRRLHREEGRSSPQHRAQSVFNLKTTIENTIAGLRPVGMDRGKPVKPLYHTILANPIVSDRPSR